MKRDPEITQELTGYEARQSEAEHGDAGSGASRFGGDLSGVEPADYEENAGDRLEPEPSLPRDIMPDRIVAKEGAIIEEDDDSVSARPSQSLRPITADLLPSDDPAAAEGDEDARSRAFAASGADAE